MRVHEVPVGGFVAGDFDAGASVRMIGSGVAVVVLDKEHGAYAVGHLSYLDAVLDDRRRERIGGIAQAFRDAGGDARDAVVEVFGGATFLDGGCAPGLDSPELQPSFLVIDELSTHALVPVEWAGSGHTCLNLAISVTNQKLTVENGARARSRAA